MGGGVGEGSGGGGKKKEEPMVQEWKEKYASYYLNLLNTAMIGNFPYPVGKLYDSDFWEAFTIEFNRIIAKKFPNDNFTGFTINNVIINGRRLEACYKRQKRNSCQPETFADYDRCFNGPCNNFPVFPHFEAPNCTSTCSLDMSRATTSGNGGLMQMVSLRLSTLVNDGILDAKKCPKVLEHFCRNDVLAQTWIQLKGDVNQMDFLNNL